MDRLPKEIVLLIISDFTLKEKLQCALVCRKWLNWIRESSLYKQLSIQDSADRYRTALDYFENHNYGKLVSELTISNCLSTLVALLKLPEIFPNIKEFEWNQEYDEEYADYSLYQQEVKDKYYESQLQKWKKLESIKEENIYFPITTAILKSPSSAANLRTISITCSSNELAATPDDIKFHQSISTILKNIKNAPKLTTLVLENFLITWDDMDRLHNRVKNLKSITLKNMFLRSTDEYSDEASGDESSSDGNSSNYSANPSSINSATTLSTHEPADSVEAFAIEYVSDIFEIERGNIFWWTRYIAKKYRNITSFSLTYNSWIFMPISATSFEEMMEFSLPCWPKLKTYNAKIGGLTKALLDVMDKSQIALEDVTIYIDEDGATEQYTNLMKSNQIQSIRALRIIERAKFQPERYYGIDMFALFRQVPNLKHVELNVEFEVQYHHDVTIIAHILNNAIHVESLVAPNLLGLPKAFVPMTHDSKLKRMEVGYFQFCSDTGTEVFSTTMTGILNHCPLLEYFTTSINIYERKARGTSILFNFAENPHIKAIRIDCLYKTTFKIIRKYEVKCYAHTEEGDFIEIPEMGAPSPYIIIAVNNQATILSKLLMIEKNTM